jgi:hypothetical protein
MTDFVDDILTAITKGDFNKADELIGEDLFNRMHDLLDQRKREVAKDILVAEAKYTCVHAKKGKLEDIEASSSYGAAKKAAEKWKLKSTAGIDAYKQDTDGPTKAQFN